ncbi:hypothetical protein KMP13_17185 [Epibacterium ulvae]|uniref:hypothetical protein n=1 Tax=Epibacterium ulvae TaxID=1156985 RepID=UPI001BFC57F1|nr:hypothetical protein [Epibacterium ulvae]MBT8155569.1 hypothetical protein [Epibacterium ulvae]
MPVDQDDTQAEAVLGQLITLCGKMRMLSHRIVMIVLLDSCRDEQKTLGIEAYTKSVEEFSEIAGRISLTRAHSPLPPAVLDAMQAVQAITPAQEAQLDKLLKAARSLEPDGSGSNRNESRLVALA